MWRQRPVVVRRRDAERVAAAAVTHIVVRGIERVVGVVVGRVVVDAVEPAADASNPANATMVVHKVVGVQQGIQRCVFVVLCNFRKALFQNENLV